jgi:hypothetical protein
LGASVTFWEATAPVKLPTSRCSRPGFTGAGGGATPGQSGISPSAPAPPRGRPRSLPPILRRPGLTPTTSYSKAPRGLFVPPRDARIFTGTSISPGPLPRQRPTRCSIRAGRNLPDKEFRYLRTIIVIAAVHQGFGSGLAPLPLTVWHRAGVSPHTSPRGLAETCVFGKQSVGPFHCARRTLPVLDGTRPPGPLLPKLRGQFAEFLGRGSPDHLGILMPAHRCRFAVRACPFSLEAFRAGAASRELAVPRGVAFPSPLTPGQDGFAGPGALRAWTSIANKTLALAPRVPPSVLTNGHGTGLSTRCPSPTLT